MIKRIQHPDRKLELNIFDKPNSPIEKRRYRLGQHGQRRKVYSNYARRLIERQRLKVLHNVSSSYLDNCIRKAKLQYNPENFLLGMLQQRLDQIVYRLGFAPTIFAARQVVNHKHFLVNGKRVNIPSYKVKPGEIISVRESSRGKDIINRCIELNADKLPPYLKKIDTYSGTLTRLPENKEELNFLPFDLNISRVIESI